MNRPTRPGDTTVPRVGIPTAPPLPEDLEALLRRLRLPHIRRHAPTSSRPRKPNGGNRSRSSAPCSAKKPPDGNAQRWLPAAPPPGFPTGKTFEAWKPEVSSIPAPTQQALRT